MTELVANYLMDKISAVSFADKYTGLVRPFTYKDCVYPVGCQTSPDECEDKYMDFVPDDKKISVMYFEDRGSRFLNFGERCSHTEIESNVRLVVWLNGCRIGGNECDLSARAMLEILRILGQCPNGGNYDVLTAICIEAVSEEVKSKRIFSRYTYDKNVPYLMYPCDYFALNLRVRYRVPFSCIEPMEILPEPCC